MYDDRTSKELEKYRNAATLYMNLMRMSVVFSTKDERARKKMLDKLHDVSTSEEISKKDKYIRDISAMMGKARADSYDYSIDEVTRYIDGHDIKTTDTTDVEYPPMVGFDGSRLGITHAFSNGAPTVSIYYEEYKRAIQKVRELKAQKDREDHMAMKDPVDRPQPPHGPRRPMREEYHHDEHHKEKHSITDDEKELLSKKSLTPQEMERILSKHPEIKERDTGYVYGRDTIEYGRLIFNFRKKTDINLEEMMKFAVAVSEALPTFLLRTRPGVHNELIDSLGVPRSLEAYTTQYERFMSKFYKLSKKDQEEAIKQLNDSPVKKAHDRRFGTNNPYPGLVKPVDLKREVNRKVSHELIEGNMYGPLDTYKINLRLATRYMSVEEINRVYGALLDKHRKYVQMQESIHEGEPLPENGYEEALQSDFVDVMYPRTKNAKKISESPANTPEQQAKNMEAREQTELIIIDRVMNDTVKIERLKGKPIPQTRIETPVEEMFMSDETNKTFENVSTWNALLTKIRSKGKGRTR